jgi:hypothetical protein
MTPPAIIFDVRCVLLLTQRRFLPSVVLASLLSACSGGGAGLAPAQNHATSAARTTKATFTIRWTNASAPASVRHKDTISPSAASISVTINGALNTIANRNTQPSQTITLVAPVGQDLFLFQVYDLPNGTGHLLGTATVTQLIVDGVANTVTAVIQAVCAVTNVQVLSASPLIQTTSAASGIYAASLQSIELVGPQPATLQVGPEDVDGNVIIAGPAGAVAYSPIATQATVTPINGTQISLAPAEVSPTAAAATLTVAAPSCPTTTVAIKSSPAIFLEYTSGLETIIAYDFYANLLAVIYVGGTQLVGYDSRSNQLILYVPSSGAVYSIAQNLTNEQYLYTVPSNALVTWSNYADSVFGALYFGGGTQYFTYNGGVQPVAGPTSGVPVAVTSATMSSNPAVFATNGTTIYAFSLASGTQTGSFTASYPVIGLATDDTFQNGTLYSFNSGGSPDLYTDYAENLGYVCCSFNLIDPIAESFATDTGSFNTLYSFLANGDVYAFNSSTHTSLSILPTFSFGTPVAIVVASTNEH